MYNFSYDDTCLLVYFCCYLGYKAKCNNSKKNNKFNYNNIDTEKKKGIEIVSKYI